MGRWAGAKPLCWCWAGALRTRSRIRPRAHTLPECSQQCSPRAVIEGNFCSCLTALGHRPNRPLPSMVQQCPLGVASGAAPSFAFGAWFCRDAPAAPYFAGALFPVRRVSLGLVQTAVVRRPWRAAAGPGRARPVLNPRPGAGRSGGGGPRPCASALVGLAARRCALRFPAGGPVPPRSCCGRPAAFAAALGSVAGGPGRGVWPRCGARRCPPGGAALFPLPPPLVVLCCSGPPARLGGGCRRRFLCQW